MSNKVFIEVGAKISEALKNLDALTKSIKKVGDSAGEISAKSGVAFAALSGFIGVAVKNFGEQERAINKMNQVLQTQGIYTDELSKKYVELSGKLQEKSNFADEEILSAMGTVQAYLGEIEVTEDLTKSILNLAQAKGLDLRSAAELVGKSIGSDTNALSRMGVAVDSTAEKETKLAQVIGGLNKLFEGQAETASKDVLGSINQAKMAIGDLLELIGQEFAPIISEVALKIRELSKALQNNKEALKIGVTILGVTTAMAGLVTAVAGGVKVFALIVTSIKSATLAIYGLGAAMAANPITAILSGMTIAVGAFSMAWVTNFGKIQEITMGTLEAIKTAFKVSFDKIVEYFSAFYDIVSGAANYDVGAIKAGIERWKSINISIIEETSKAYSRGYTEREELNKKSLDVEVNDSQKSEKKKYESFSKRIDEEEKKRKEAEQKASDDYTKLLMERESEAWDSLIRDNENSEKAKKDLEEQRLTYYLDRLTSEELESAKSTASIMSIQEQAESTLKEIHEMRLRRIKDEYGASLEGQSLVSSAEFQYYKDREALQAKFKNSIKEANKEQKSFLEDLIDRFSSIAGIISGIGTSIENAAQFGNDLASGAGVRSAANVTDDISTIPSELNTAIDELYNATQGSADRWSEQFQKVMDRLERFPEYFSKEFPKLAQKFAEGIGLLMTNLTKGLLSIGNTLIQSFAPMLSAVFGQVIPMLIGQMPQLLGLFLDGIQIALDSLLTNAPAIITSFFDIIPELIAKINEAIPSIVQTIAENILPIVGALIAGLVKSAPSLIMAWVEVSVAWAAIGAAISWAMAALTPVWAMIAGLISAGMSLLAPVWAFIGTLIGTAVTAGMALGIPLLVGAAVALLAVALWKFRDEINEFFFKIFDGIKNVIKGIFDSYVNIWNGILTSIKSVFSWIIDAFTSLFEWLRNIVDGIKNIGSNVGGGIKSGVSKIGKVLGFSDGGLVPKKTVYAATGAFIPKGSDTVPAMLSEGEFVVNRGATEKNLSTLKNINSGSLSSAPEEIVLRIVGDDDFGRMIEKSLIRMSTLGTGRLRVAVGSEA